MNRRYYACRLQEIQRWLTVLDIVVAISASGTIAAWSVFKDGGGSFAWKTFAAVAAVVAVVKPFLRLSKDVERYSELVVGYAAVYFDMKAIVQDIKTEGRVTDEAWARFSVVRQRTKDLGLKDDLIPKRKLHQRCFHEVNNQIPSATLWWPIEEDTV
jgi:hypothetical protein